MDTDSGIFQLDNADLSVDQVGGKAANLSRLAASGFPVPRGFVLGVSAYEAHVRAWGLLDRITGALAPVARGQGAELRRLADEIEAWFLETELDSRLSAEISDRYATLGAPPVAVRSSATLEDTPDFSYAGQQETFVNVRGEVEVGEAILRCWASLFSERAIAYRHASGDELSGGGIGVVVQELVDAEVSGVLFTADPRSGSRLEMAVEVVPGLGEGLVSGVVEPDQYRIEAETGVVLERRIRKRSRIIRPSPRGGTELVDGSDSAALGPDQLAELARFGRRAAGLLGGPQDIEWAVGGEGIKILQSRWITSLYPAPTGLEPQDLHVLVSYAATQGVNEPITPLGRDVIRSIHTASGRVFGYELGVDAPETLFDAGERLWQDVTGLFRSRIGRRVLFGLLRALEPSAGRALRSLRKDPRLATDGGFSLRFAWRVLPATLPMLGRMVLSLIRPRREVTAYLDESESLVRQIEGDFAHARSLSEVAGLALPAMMRVTETMLPRFIPRYWAGVLSQMIFARLAKGVPGGSELALLATRGLPNNVTSEMNLQLAEVAERIDDDPASRRAFIEQQPAALANEYLAGRLPAVAQKSIAEFLAVYGARGIGEIDVGRPRWVDDPTPVMTTLQEYVSQSDPHVRERFSSSVFEAEQAMGRVVSELASARFGAVRSRLAGWAAMRMRSLTGLRESPKFDTVRVRGFIREALLDCGAELAESGVLDQRDDVFFLHVSELRQIADAVDEDWKGLVADRRAAASRESKRRQIPRLLLSDGRAFYETADSEGDASDDLAGDPVSPGVSEGPVRVVTDPTHQRVAPGEILVCRATDPAWTPLFLTAGGLIMESGGLMTHGSVVAREFGIPAVVGVAHATTRLETGQRIRLDGTTGRIEVL